MATIRKAQIQTPMTRGTVLAAPPPTAAGAVPREEIAKRAYEIWQARGCRHGEHEAHWYQAERELRARLGR